ncbi:MAG TPA: tetraacyldisaccharide 4'-kinase [Stellaceae bacterium]|nr:tetraacyldisaccharide 4'-kinase [Stellaceae bacterium]
MQAPEFWRRRGALSTALLPAAAGYGVVAAWRRRRTTPVKAPLPTICVGNLVAGGGGKTPLALALAERLKARGRAVHLLSRGYRGRLEGPVMVDPALHTFRDVGDEPLLLAAAAPTWVSRDRLAGATAAAAAGADLVLLDDGLQNPRLAYDLSLIAIDGGYGFGNGRLLPAGPLRERVEAGLERAAAAVVIGEDEAGVAAVIAGRLPILHARLVPQNPAPWAGRRVVAFAGIARPVKFFATLDALGAETVARFAFADHHPYAEGELMAVLARAAAASALAVTTEKDWHRLPPQIRAQVETLPVRLEWDDGEALLDQLLDRVPA